MTRATLLNERKLSCLECSTQKRSNLGEESLIAAQAKCNEDREKSDTAAHLIIQVVQQMKV